jgi:hypothetical protein
VHLTVFVLVLVNAQQLGVCVCVCVYVYVCVCVRACACMYDNYVDEFSWLILWKITFFFLIDCFINFYVKETDVHAFVEIVMYYLYINTPE